VLRTLYGNNAQANPFYALAQDVVARHLAGDGFGSFGALSQLQDSFSTVAGSQMAGAPVFSAAGWMPPPAAYAASPVYGYAPTAYVHANPYDAIGSMLTTPYQQNVLNGLSGVLYQRPSAGTAGPYQPAFGLSPSNGGDTAGVLNDPSLTVEDKVTLMIMLIMQKMDKDIEKMAQDINKLQQQQQQGAGGGGGGGKGGGGGGAAAAGGDKSIDVETMKMKRLIDKRSQMFDMLRQIIDKYNQTAKGIIDSMR
jgi:hypothetical protein